ncbi:MAG: septum formation initiator family protein [Candidatus Krumholzibacteria bacterium]|nr:septum formation initiator family protein [Candidatus Krumholzibacteria bacterium]
MRYWEPAKKARAAKRKTRTSSKRSIASSGSLREYPFLRKFYQHQAVISVGIQKFLFFLVIATLLYAFVFGDGGVIRIMTLRTQKADLEETLAMIDHDIESVTSEIERLQNDPSTMEKLGREKYGYVYPGDRVYKIIHPHK